MKWSRTLCSETSGLITDGYRQISAKISLAALTPSMLNHAEARELAAEWIRAWNSHDLDAIMSHYASDVVLTSPAAAKLLNRPSGTVVGKEALRNYFQTGLAAFPNLKFELLDLLIGISSIVLYFLNHKGTKTAEYLEFNSAGKIIRVVANYSE